MRTVSHNGLHITDTFFVGAILDPGVGFSFLDKSFLRMQIKKNTFGNLN